MSFQLHLPCHLLSCCACSFFVNLSKSFVLIKATLNSKSSFSDRNKLTDMVSFFGLIVHLNPATTVVVFSMLIVTLIILQHALMKMEALAEQAKFGELVKKLYKEMMVMGFIGFFVFIVYNVFTLKQDEYYMAFEFAHITIFFITIMLVFRALFVVISSGRDTAGFWRAHNQKCAVILDRYNLVKDSFWNLDGFLFHYFPIWSSLFTDIEYKIMEDFFHSDFNLSRYEFSFVDYLTMSNKLYAVERVEMSNLSWLMIIVLAIVNYIRILITKGDTCRDHASDQYKADHRGRSSTADDEEEETDVFVVSTRCANYNTLYFMAAGLALVLFGLFITFITWRSKVELLKIAGNNSNDYEDVLIDVMTREQDTFEALAQKHDEMDVKRKAALAKAEAMAEGGVFISPPKPLMSASSLRHLAEEDNSWHVVSLRKVLEEQAKRTEDRERQRVERLRRWFYDLLDTLYIGWAWDLLAESSGGFIGSRRSRGLQKLQALARKRRAFGVRSLSMEDRPAAGRTRRLSCSVDAAAEAAAAVAAKFVAASMGRVSASDDAPAVHRKSMSVAQLRTIGKFSKINGGGEVEIHPLMYELDSIFIFESRRVYARLLEGFQMMCSLYMSLYLTNFIFIVVETDQVVIFTIFILCSICALLLIMSFTQFHSNVLFSVTSLQNEATAWICKEDAIKNKTLPRLRQELIDIIDKEDFMQEIENLFSLVNENDDDGIDMSEFSNLLFTLNIQLSDTEVQCMFRVLNVSGTGQIGIRELKELLRPNSSFLSREAEKATPVLQAAASQKRKRSCLVSAEAIGIAASSPTVRQATGGGGGGSGSAGMRDSPSFHSDRGSEVSTGRHKFIDPTTVVAVKTDTDSVQSSQDDVVQLFDGEEV